MTKKEKNGPGNRLPHKPCVKPSRGEDMTEYNATRKRRKTIAKAQARAQAIANRL